MEDETKKPMFKVGDKVTIKQRVGDNSDYKFSFADSMAALAGKQFTIQSIIENYDNRDKRFPDDGCKYYLEEVGYSWASSMFEEPVGSLTLCTSECSCDNSIDSFIKKKKRPELDFNL